MNMKYISILIILALFVLTACNTQGIDQGVVPTDAKEPQTAGAEIPVGAIDTDEVTSEPEDVKVKTPEDIIRKAENPAVYADYSSDIADEALGKKPVVLFFTGKDCPNCVKLDADIKENISGFENAVILKADFIPESDLAKKFRITEKDTLVFVDKDGGSYNKKVRANINDIRNFLNLNR